MKTIYKGTGRIDETSTKMIIEISEPSAGENNHFCIVQIYPLFSQPKKIYGTDPQNASECAHNFVKEMLDHVQFEPDEQPQE